MFKYSDSDLQVTRSGGLLRPVLQKSESWVPESCTNAVLWNPHPFLLFCHLISNLSKCRISTWKKSLTPVETEAFWNPDIGWDFWDLWQNKMTDLCKPLWLSFVELNLNVKLFNYKNWRIFSFLGADQLAAAKLCFLHAKQWRDSEKSEKAETGFLKVSPHL